jgi:hypothetical protein
LALMAVAVVVGGTDRKHGAEERTEGLAGTAGAEDAAAHLDELPARQEEQRQLRQPLQEGPAQRPAETILHRRSRWPEAVHGRQVPPQHLRQSLPTSVVPRARCLLRERSVARKNARGGMGDERHLIEKQNWRRRVGWVCGGVGFERDCEVGCPNSHAPHIPIPHRPTERFSARIPLIFRCLSASFLSAHVPLSFPLPLCRRPPFAPIG